MKFTLPLALAALAAAAPAPQPTTNVGSLSSSASQHLAPDDVIIYGVNGEHKIIKEAEFQNLTAAGILTYGGDDPLESRAAPIARRACNGRESSEFTVTSKADFLDWDVQISPVVGAQQAAVTISVSKGYTLTNTITVSAGISGAYSGIGLSVGVDVSKAWATTDTTTFLYQIPVGQYGVIVSQPWTHRVYGDVYTACDETNWTKAGTFMASSHTSQSYGSFDWVTGVFRLCANEAYPVPFCNGNGFHH
ncbi:hypothetical protein Cob_v000028 [Colletotrichum orbiculare MAFF 240422]|uniref:Celp0028 effector like protein n=1 Tax=Colletotrichum orbiculare (strain 104-T / ATCC 96160 / CBS 514.97 / LARS 414 / MAFF 240422) TaxID=1213857 RepID=N4VH80_COLOR|nr:hypothetical protein Cob_v000028 [Colletotrichum orbiculare MAFF 240422]